MLKLQNPAEAELAVAAASAAHHRTATAAPAAASTTSAAVTAASATTAAATVAAASAAAATAFTLRTRFVHHERAAQKILAVQRRDRFLRFGIVTNFSETEPARLARETIASNVSESGCTPISENNACTCSSVALNERLPTYSFFTVVLLVPP